MSPADLDFAHAWHGDRTDPRTLLADRPTGTHPLTRGAILHGSAWHEALGVGLLAHLPRGQAGDTMRDRMQASVDEAAARHARRRYVAGKRAKKVGS